MTMKQGLEPFIPFPRALASDLRDGKITLDEFGVYNWIRLNVDPYGKAVMSLSDIYNDAFPNLSINYVNKILLRLKKKRYIYYENRQGRRGSFDIHVGEIRLPHGGVKTLDQFFECDDDRLSEELPTKPSEVSQKLEAPSQKLQEAKDQLIKAFTWPNDEHPVRSHYNENEKENNIENDLAIIQKISQGTELGQGEIEAFIQKHGRGAISAAYGLFKADPSGGFASKVAWIVRGRTTGSEN